MGGLFFAVLRYLRLVTDAYLPMTTAQHMAQLRARGLSFDNAEAEAFFGRVSYYRFSHYARHYRIDKTRGAAFVSEARLNTIIETYEFDDALRRLVWRAICKVEIAFRTQFGNKIALTYGSLAYRDPLIFNKMDLFFETDTMIGDQLTRSKEPFVREFVDRIPREDPYVWVAFEALSFGLLSKLLSNLKDPKLVGSMAKEWKLDHSTFVNAIYQVSLIRNVVAHHGMLWARTWARGSDVTYPDTLSKSLEPVDKGSTYRVLVMLAHLLDAVDSSKDFQRDVLRLLERNPASWAQIGVPGTTLPSALLFPAPEVGTVI